MSDLREQIVVAIQDGFRFKHPNQPMNRHRVDAAADRILALLPAAPGTKRIQQTVGVDDSFHTSSTVGTARRAKAYLELVDDRYLVMLGTGSDEDYCVSEFLKHEKYDAEVTAQVINEALEDARTPATTGDVGGERPSLEEYAQFFEDRDSVVGAGPMTGEQVARFLRGPAPFGRAASVKGDGK